MRLLFRIHDLYSFTHPIYERECIHNRFKGSVSIRHSHANSDTIPPVVSGSHGVLPQLHRCICSSAERLDAVSIPEYGDQPVGSTVLASFGWISYLLCCSDECSLRKRAWRIYFGIYKFYHYIPWQFSDLSSAGCGVQRSGTHILLCPGRRRRICPSILCRHSRNC